MTISNITDRKCVRCNQERPPSTLPALPEDPDQRPLLNWDNWIETRDGGVCPDCMTLGERLNYEDRCTRCGRQDEHEDDENEWNTDYDDGSFCPDCYSRFDSLHFIASLIKGALLRARSAEPYQGLHQLELGAEIAESLRPPGRFVVQTARAIDGESDEGNGWTTHGVFPTRAEAERMERFFASGDLHESTVDLDDDGSLDIDVGDVVPSVTVSRVIDLRDLITEGPEAIHRAMIWLVTSDHEWTMTLGTVQSRFYREIPGVDDQDDDEAAAA